MNTPKETPGDWFALILIAAAIGYGLGWAF